MDDKRKQELLQRATATKPAAARPAQQPAATAPRRQVPPPAKKIPGITGNPPLPSKAPVRLTQTEQRALAEVGWDASMPLPANIQPALAELRESEWAADQDEVILPVDPRTPPPEIPPEIPYDSLPPAQKKKVAEVFSRQIALEKEAMESQEASATLTSIPGGMEAMQMLDTLPDAVVIDDSAAPATKEVAASTNETGAMQPLVQFCPNCTHDMAQPAGPEPPYEIKMAFLHSILAQQPFFNTEDLFGGKMTITLRTLTSREIETIFKQAYRDQHSKRSTTEVDFWERVNRYRLFLQIVKIKTSTTPEGFVEDFPSGLSPETNDTAKVHWSTQCSPPEPDETYLTQIERIMLERYLKQEQKFRICNNASNRFNRIVARLEALVDNSDFWNPIETHA